MTKWWLDYWPRKALSSLGDMNALHHAAKGGHDKVVALLLAARNDLVPKVTRAGKTALHLAVEMGHEKVFDQLLFPCLIGAVCADGTILHCAARNGHDHLVGRILALRPTMIDSVNHGYNALEWAIKGGHQTVAGRLLATKPELISRVAHHKNTVLHIAVEHLCDPQFVAKLWRMDALALQNVNSTNRTPFHLAILKNKNELIELFQWRLSFDDIVCAFTQEGISYQERYRPVIEEQCESLLGDLNQDVMSTVFEYLGFDPIKRHRVSCVTFHHDEV